MPATSFSLSSLQHTAEKCTDCGICINECLFLRNTGSPAQIAQESLKSEQQLKHFAQKAYDCSMCRLCSAICPFDAKPDEIFAELRNHAQTHDVFDLKRYSPLLGYEKMGGKFPFKDNILPKDCTTAFFPGCTLPALFPQATLKTFDFLRGKDKNFGLILNCCAKPSKMLGLSKDHESAITHLITELKDKGVKRILTGCPNCHQTLKEAKPPFEVFSIYEELRDKDFKPVNPYFTETTIHDPCVTRYEDEVHISIRDLLFRAEIKITEMKSNKRKTICCGEGGAVPFQNKNLSTAWTERRISEASATKLPMTTYCAGCVNYLSPKHPTTHILDLLMVERDNLPKLTNFPFNYANRLLLRLSARMK